MRQDLMDRMHRILIDEAVMNSAHPIKARVYYPRVNIALRWILWGIMIIAVMRRWDIQSPFLLFLPLAFPAVQWYFPLPPHAPKLAKILQYCSVLTLSAFLLFIFLIITLGTNHHVYQIIGPCFGYSVWGALFVLISYRILQDIKLWKNASTVDSKTGTIDSV